MRKLIAYSIAKPKTIIALSLVLTALFAWQMQHIVIDTDPENMLSADQTDRQFYNKVKQDFGINDLVVVGIVTPNTIYQKDSLKNISNYIDEAIRIPGIIPEDVVSLRSSNDVRSKDNNIVVQRLLSDTSMPPEELRLSIDDNPLYKNKIVSTNGTATALYIPIKHKKDAHKIGTELKQLAQKILPQDYQIHIAGLPIAEDQFGVEMFAQMGIMAPLSGMAICILLWIVFRKGTLIIPVMGVAMLTVIWSMGLLIGSGFTVHIMSSMLPVFLMPIAVLDSVHVLSEYYDRFRHENDSKLALQSAYEKLYTPMLYTSLTTSAGFASLVLTNIPPVQVFGVFIAIGIMFAWFLSMSFLPACVVLSNESKLKKVIDKRSQAKQREHLENFGNFAFKQTKVFVGLVLGLVALSFFGIFKTVVNDNPVRWFSADHEIRLADKSLNELFSGTYMAYLVFESNKKDTMKDPNVIQYIDKLQQYLNHQPHVGKTSSIVDVIKQVNYVVHNRQDAFRSIPNSQNELAQYLLLYQMSGDVNDLDNFIDYDYQNANIWIQMKKGDNQVMEDIKNSVDRYVANNPLPANLHYQWSGLTYINKVWQDLMVTGMIKATLGSFVVVFIMMIVLFRSLVLSLYAMIPLSFAIILIYGLAGLVGKEYDMPIAVCSSLALGLAIDFAIHFIQRHRRALIDYQHDFDVVNKIMFGDTARAILRNVFVIALGFAPMILSPLGPYKTVGAFFALLIIFSSFATLGLLPGLLRHKRVSSS